MRGMVLRELGPRVQLGCSRYADTWEKGAHCLRGRRLISLPGAHGSCYTPTVGVRAQRDVLQWGIEKRSRAPFGARSLTRVGRTDVEQDGRDTVDLEHFLQLRIQPLQLATRRGWTRISVDGVQLQFDRSLTAQ